MNANLLEVRYFDPRVARPTIIVGRLGERGGFASIYLHDRVVWFRSHDGERFGIPVERCVELIPEPLPPLPTMPDAILAPGRERHSPFGEAATEPVGRSLGWIAVLRRRLFGTDAA